MSYGDFALEDAKSLCEHLSFIVPMESEEQKMFDKLIVIKGKRCYLRYKSVVKENRKILSDSNNYS